VVVLATLIGTAGAAAAATSAGASGNARHAARPAHRVGPVQLSRAGVAFKTNQSNNWSGYNQGALTHGGTFSAITGTWQVPTATQHKSGEAESSATWIGIGGGCLENSCTLTDQTLIQAGTEQDVAANGAASYGTWYELIPAPSVSTPLVAHPGDTVTSTIKSTVPGLWSISLKNVTTGKSWSTTVPYASTGGSAEWIEETPLLIGASGTGISALPNLGSVHFSGATTNGAAAKLTAAEAMQLVSSSGSVLATPSAPGAGGASFNDCTYATTCGAP
jgi:peptidase A4-like protein